MHAASRNALTTGTEFVDKLLWESVDKVSTAAQVGTELFLVVDRLDEERALRVNLADASLTSEQRSGIAQSVFGGKIAQPSLDVLTHAAAQKWSTTREFRDGLVQLGRRALLRGAEHQGQLEQVEDDLYRLSRTLIRELKLTQLLGDQTAEVSARRGLLANVLYGKANMFTEALALQVIGRPENNPVDDVAALSFQAAELRGKSVARVETAVELTEGQQAALAEKLEQIYGREMSIHSEVDPSLLGGMTIRVDDERIDGSTRGKLARMRAGLK
ncbi:F0F1 ATP synthase subunit delta [Corynebacterium guangdongense]|uniref:ATP synthase subunit delta n=1 Tax=Corynebacterium guangdongense TaxID=1783348 RepID=A0ABU1ZVZ7_9CORY|nr:F0F1 ATP synthase subunit delta [Corynebacterium guangdongense]MDR7329117.1 F-type H+-transporting ATPase subunit delta [Corynebacterium guangdongense]WJZ17686.1 ATP synthase subunit delta [Corynebacterium guangdongense]